MIRVPNTYSDWVNVLDIFKSKTNDEEVLAAMKQGTIQWQSGVAERFANALTSAVNFRLNAASDKFQKEMSYAHGSERGIVNALISLRKELAFLADAVNLPVIPEKDRYQYISLVREQANEVQDSLEDSAKRDRTGKMLSIVRNHKINTF
jgi:hypothetical protein